MVLKLDNLILEYVSTTLYFIHLNGMVVSFIGSSWKIGQGDPISPFLFLAQYKIFQVISKDL